MMKEFLLDTISDISKIRKIRGEASTRSFYRITHDDKTKIAMVYPDKNSVEINNIIRLTELYKKHQLNVPEIFSIIDDRIIILEDIGTESFQSIFKRSNSDNKKKLLKIIAQIISKLHQIPINNTSLVLDKKRLKWEMDFFIKHYIQDNISKANEDCLRANLYTIVDNISDEIFFCHRDFHSRNMHIYNDKVYLIDFQDSLQGSYLYDIVSFANDSYLDLGKLRAYFFSQLESQNIKIDKQQLNLTALQRNIKALGTFGYQINIRKNLSYKKYIGRTLSHIKKNPEGKSIWELITI